MSKKEIIGIFCDSCGIFIQYEHERYKKEHKCEICDSHLCDKCVCEVELICIEREYKLFDNYASGGSCTNKDKIILCSNHMNNLKRIKILIKDGINRTR